MSRHPSPEEAAIADDAIPARLVKGRAVEYSPYGREAVVLIEYNEPPTLDAYVVLCRQTGDGWVAGQGGAGGGSSWMSTTEDGSLGVEIFWGPSSHRVEWDVPGGPDFEGPSDSQHGD
jgi:hypothetical protein